MTALTKCHEVRARLEDELTAANERIRMLTDAETLMRRNAQEWKDAATAKREVSDKLEKALNDALRSMQVSSYHPCKTEPMNIMEDALAEVAAIRNQPAVKTYCGGKPNYATKDKA